MEYLETQGVFVSTFNDNNRHNVEIPGFYCRESGVVSPYSFDNYSSIASTIHHQNNIMGLSTGNVICVPPPHETALDSGFINRIIDEAITEGEKLGIKGKELTPFLLGKIALLTNGRSVECNINFVLNNAKAATSIAAALLDLENGKTTSFTPTVVSKTPQTQVQQERSDLIIVGSLAMDTIVSMERTMKMNDSNPGLIRNSVGGVGHNVTMASHYGLQSKFCNSNKKARLVSVVGEDISGKSILSSLESIGVDTLGILVSPGSTAQYVSNHDANGDLIVACADMKLIEQDFSNHIIRQIDRSSPQSVILDCNISSSVATKVVEHLRGKDINVIIEPTSFAKAARIGQIPGHVFPSNVIDLITPTVAELDAIYTSFAANEKFDDLDNWFPLVDSLGITTQFRERLTMLASRPQYTILGDLLNQGVLQQAFQILPYIPNILVKLGDKGVVMVCLSTSISDYNSIPTTSPYTPQFILTSKSTTHGQLGIAIKYFPIPKENQNLDIINVSGAGDAMVGYLAATLLSGPNWLLPNIQSVEQEWYQWESIYKAQLASGQVLKSEKSTTSNILLIE
jgi:pseudouridine-5'-phosphate glycosidase/pseudouridine kinase